LVPRSPSPDGDAVTRDDLDRFFHEDLGVRGDLTTRALFGRATRVVRARVFARERLVAAGLLEAAEAFGHLRVQARPARVEGTWAPAGATLLDVRGPLAGVLAAERLALNLLGRMSGIATQTRRLQDRVARVNPACRVAATRKTTPGFRLYEKRAVALGGGDPHRYGLYDAILIKDNHLDALAGDVARAVQRALAARPRVPIQVEVGSAAQARAAARAGAQWILIDNQTAAAARRIAAAARATNPHVRIECSGGLTPARLTAYAPFSDRLSLGGLTHSAQSANVSLELTRRPSAKP
jgi:nicotinate-nucleotide pyrophosphorylase (carboxylating)